MTTTDKIVELGKDLTTSGFALRTTDDIDTSILVGAMHRITIQDCGVMRIERNHLSGHLTTDLVIDVAAFAYPQILLILLCAGVITEESVSHNKDRVQDYAPIRSPFFGTGSTYSPVKPAA